MERKRKFRMFILPSFGILFAIGNYCRLSGIDNVRAIHVVSLLVLGVFIGILLRNIYLHFKGII